MNMTLFICEKRSQADDLAKALGHPESKGSHYDTDRGRVTWASGHFLELCEPEDYDPKFADRRDYSLLPIVPQRFRYIPISERDGMTGQQRAYIRRCREQLKAIGALLKEAPKVVIATDADRQGEAIARNILEHFGFNREADLQRLFVRSKSAASIQKALNQLKSGRETLPITLGSKGAGLC